MKKRSYDYEQAAKAAADNERECPDWRGTTVRRVLRRLVREAAIKGLRHWSGTRGKPTVTERVLADAIAKELIP